MRPCELPMSLVTVSVKSCSVAAKYAMAARYLCLASAMDALEARARNMISMSAKVRTRLIVTTRTARQTRCPKGCVAAGVTLPVALFSRLRPLACVLHVVPRALFQCEIIQNESPRAVAPGLARVPELRPAVVELCHRRKRPAATLVPIWHRRNRGELNPM